MRNFKAIFRKQLKDTLKNPAVLINFFLFPLVALMMNFFAMPSIEGVPAEIADIIAAGMPNMALMMAAMFIGAGLIPPVAGFIAEDIEKKSLRFLTMAGVKPVSYLLGVGGVSLFLSAITSIAFGLISDFRGIDMWIFVAALMSAALASVLLGAMVGIASKNQQSAAGLSLPAAMVLGFGPMMAQFNPAIGRILHPFYTQQLNLVADSLGGTADTPLWQAFAIIWANVAVLGILFAVVYQKKGLKG